MTRMTVQSTSTPFITFENNKTTLLPLGLSLAAIPLRYIVEDERPMLFRSNIMMGLLQTHEYIFATAGFD
jgi:hypothetical protein